MSSMPDTWVEPTDRAAIIDVYNAYAEGIDSKNWEMVRNCFADEVCIDYGEAHAAGGGPHDPRSADAWMQSLQSVINGFDFTRHTITNHRFERDKDLVVCRAYLTADHVILANPEIPEATADEISTVVGEYTNTCKPTADGWKIVKSRLNMEWARGNTELFVIAMQRAAQA
jgi:3-phenylpropionate/cinnamic acid dioxygenase small subunit